VNVKALELLEVWQERDPRARVRADFPLQAAAGTKTTAVVYFEIAPGDYLPRHTDSAEEILYVVAGRGEAVVGGGRVPLEPGVLALVPELVPHAVYNTGETTLEVVGFFSAAKLEHVFDEPLQPFGERIAKTPAPVPATVA
jgi:quercetin dioxygenase-like cupin family protein